MVGRDDVPWKRGTLGLGGSLITPNRPELGATEAGASGCGLFRYLILQTRYPENARQTTAIDTHMPATVPGDESSLSVCQLCCSLDVPVAWTYEDESWAFRVGIAGREVVGNSHSEVTKGSTLGRLERYQYVNQHLRASVPRYRWQGSVTMRRWRGGGRLCLRGSPDQPSSNISSDHRSFWATSEPEDARGDPPRLSWPRSTKLSKSKLNLGVFKLGESRTRTHGAGPKTRLGGEGGCKERNTAQATAWKLGSIVSMVLGGVLFNNTPLRFIKNIHRYCGGAFSHPASVSPPRPRFPNQRRRRPAFLRALSPTPCPLHVPRLQPVS